MDFVYQVLRVLFVFILVKRVLLIFLGMLKKSSKANIKQEENFEETVNNNNAFIIKPSETVTTECCGKVLNKEKAFQVVTKEEMIHYFCSWDCRENFIKS